MLCREEEERWEELCGALRLASRGCPRVDVYLGDASKGRGSGISRAWTLYLLYHKL